MRHGSFLQTFKIERRYYKKFQHGNTRITEIFRSICCIYTDLEIQQMHSDNFRLIIYYIYVHLQVSVVFATIIMLLCQNIQGSSNMTGTDLCVNKPHCAAAVRP